MARIVTARPFILSALVVALLAVGLIVLLPNWMSSQPYQLKVDYLEVGQADSILLTTSDGKVVLIDGGYPDGRALKHLTDRGIRHIDLMVLTHVHDDHAGGLAAILRSIPTDLLVHNGQKLNSDVFRDYEQAVAESRVRTRVVRKGDTLRVGQMKFEVIAPVAATGESYNNNSLVMRLVDGQVTFLFTGDASELEEQQMVDSDLNLKADILKVAHHAANTSSSPAFLDRVRPKIAIYLSETGNIHGFPHKEALDWLMQVGAAIYGTDVNGSIRVESDGKTYTVTAERGEPREP